MSFVQVINPLLNQIVGGMQTFFAVITLILALLQVFAGFRMLRGWISALGGLAGFMLGVVIVGQISDQAVLWEKILVGIILAVLLGWLGWKIYLVFVFIYCGMAGAAIVISIPFPETKLWSVLSVVFTVAAFVAVGILSVHFNRAIVIIASSIGGASSAVNAMTVLGFSLASTESSRVSCFVVLVLAGLLVQFLTTGGMGRRRRRR